MRSSAAPIRFVRAALLGLAAALVAAATPADTRPVLEPHAVLSLAADPANPGILFAGTQGWGLARSIDGGRTWSEAGPSLQGLTITAVAVDPSGRVVYVGTRTQGLFISITGGATFEPAGRGLPDPEIRSVVLHPLEPRILFVSTAAGLARSDDAGLHFVPDPGTRSKDVHEVVLSAVHRNGPREESILPFPIDRPLEVSSPPSLFMVADGTVQGCDLAEPAHCKTLLDSARSRSLGGDALPTTRGHDLHLAVAPSEPNVLYVAAPFGLFRSLDRGHTWALFRTPHAARDLAVHPKLAHVLWLAHDGGIDHSVDGGVTFGTVSTPALTGIHVLIPSPLDDDGFFAAGADGRVAALENGRVRVASLHGGQIRRNGDERRSGDLPLERLLARSEISPWVGPHANQTVDVLKVDPRFPDIVYAGTRYGVFRSTDHGRAWQARNAGLGDAPVLDLVVDGADSYADDPRNGSRLIVSVAGRGLFRSVDSGALWSPVRGIPDPVVRTLAQDPVDTDLLLAGTRSHGIFYSTDGGSSWHPARRQPSVPGIRDVVITPLRLYAATDFGAVFESLDRGRTWARLGLGAAEGEAAAVGFEARRPEAQRLREHGLDSRALHVNALAADSEREGRLLAATGLGLFATDDHGASWRRVAPWRNVVGLTQSSAEPSRWLAAGAQGPLLSRDGGETWKRLELGAPAHAVVFDPFFSSTALVGDDRGTVHSVELDEPRIPVPSSRLPRPRSVPDLESLSARLLETPRPVAAEANPYREKRRALLDALNDSPDDLLLEDPRLSILLLLETHLRREDAGLDPSLDESARRLLARLKDLQRGFGARWGARQASLAPGGALAVAYAWDDGLASHSEIRLFDLERSALARPDAAHKAGPSVLWKELHDVHRRPEPPVARVLDGAGRFLAWGLGGKLLISRPQAHQAQLWDVASGRLQRTISGFPSPPKKASLSPQANVLGIVGHDGRPVRVDTRSHTLYLPSVSDSPVSAILARDDGLITAQEDGAVTFWSFDDEGTPLLETAAPVTFDLPSQDGRWWLLATGNSTERRAYLLNLRETDFAVFELGDGSWQEARFSPDQKRLLLLSDDAPARIVDLRPVQRDRPVEIFELEVTETARFDPVLPWLIGEPGSWNLDGEPFAVDFSDRSPGRELLFDTTSDLHRFFRRFGIQSRGHLPTLALPELGQTLDPSLLDSVDGYRRLILGHRGHAVAERFDTPRRVRWEEPAPARTAGIALFSLQRYDPTGAAPSPSDQWPLGLTAPAPWDPVDDVPPMRPGESSAARPGPYLSLLKEWGCLLAGRNPSADEWRRWFGDEPYAPTCHFEDLRRP